MLHGGSPLNVTSPGLGGAPAFEMSKLVCASQARCLCGPAQQPHGHAEAPRPGLGAAEARWTISHTHAKLGPRYTPHLGLTLCVPTDAALSSERSVDIEDGVNVSVNIAVQKLNLQRGVIIYGIPPRWSNCKRKLPTRTKEPLRVWHKPILIYSVDTTCICKEKKTRE